MKKIIVVLFILLSAQIFSQPEHFRRQNSNELPFQKLIYTQILVFSGDSLATINFLYKVQFQNIVFLKNGSEYKAEIRVDIEVTDTNSNFVKREIKDWKIKASSFEQTNSSEIFAEGLVNLMLPPGAYNFQPIVTDQNSKREFKLNKERVDINDSVKIEPLVVNSKKIFCESEEYFKISNFEGNIPFGSGNQSLIIPVNDISVKDITVFVVSQKDTVAAETLTESFISSIGFKECLGSVLISNGNGKKTKNFILNGIANRLQEGPYTITIDNNKEKKFNSFVFWYNKPNSLKFPELAIKALKYIEEEKVIDSLLDMDDKKQYQGLFDFWKKNDPTPETEFNELMAEFYSRVDYAQANFSSLTGKKGVDTDRGMIFIKLGKPDQIERTSNEKGKIVETWIYTKPQRKFVFVDKQGVGEFSLESS